MAREADQTDVKVTPAGGVDDRQVEPTADKSAKQIKSELAFGPDREHHPGSAGALKREVDKTSAPTALDAGPHDPPVRTAAPDVGIRTLAVGAGAHEPADREHFDADGRARISGADKDGNPVYAVSGESSQTAARKAEKG
jgi:hypothetical protein